MKAYLVERPASDWCQDYAMVIIAEQEVELIEDEDGMYVTCVGLVWHGGTEESVEIKDGNVTSFKVNGIGIAKE